MAVDEALLETAASLGVPTLRFYQWQEPTMSLGYFQEYEDRLRHAASAGCPTVRRASGGGAIMHDRELTYSLAVPEGHPLVADRLRTYRVVHESLIETLRQWEVDARLYTCYMAADVCANNKAESQGEVGWVERSEPHQGSPKESSNIGGARCARPTLLQPDRQPFLCFQRRTVGDVLAGGVKIAGSAQRRRRGAVLQHGSVLLARSAAAPELDGLKELSGRSISADNLIQAWLTKLAIMLAVEWQLSALSGDELRRAAALDSEKYSAETWIKNRGRG